MLSQIISTFLVVYLIFKNKPSSRRRQRTRVLESRPDENFGLSIVVARARNNRPWHCLGPRVPSGQWARDNGPGGHSTADFMVLNIRSDMSGHCARFSQENSCYLVFPAVRVS